MKNAKYEFSWLGAILLVALFITGALTGFKYGGVDLVLHDNYFTIPFFEILLLTFLWLTLIVVGLREARHQFMKKNGIVVLLTVNALTLIATGFLLYGIFWAASFGLLYQQLTGANPFREENPLTALIKEIQYAGLFTIILLVSFEIYLIRRLRKVQIRS